jgi:hypothetical protein
MEGEQNEPTSAGVEGVIDQHHASEGVEPVQLNVEATGTEAAAAVPQEESSVPAGSTPEDSTPIAEVKAAEEKTEVLPEHELAPSRETTEDTPVVTAEAEDKVDEGSPEATEAAAPVEQEAAGDAKEQEEVSGAALEAQAESTDPPTAPEPELVTEADNMKPSDDIPEEAEAAPLLASATEEASPPAVVAEAAEAAEAAVVKKDHKREDFILPIDEEKELPRVSFSDPLCVLYPLMNVLAPCRTLFSPPTFSPWMLTSPTTSSTLRTMSSSPHQGAMLSSLT